MVPVAFLVTIGVFVLVRISPGDPALTFAGEERDPAAIAAIREEMGLNQPVPVQYVVWLAHVAQGDLGRSFQTHQRVLEAVTERLPATLELGLAALFFSVTVALVVGILSAVKRNSIVDLLSTSITLAGVSFPSFFLGIVLILLFAYVIPGHIFPPGGYVPLAQDVGDNLRRLVHHRADLLLARDRTAGGAGHPVGRLPGGPGRRSGVRVLLHVHHARRRRSVRLVRSTHLLWDGLGMSGATLPVVLRVPRANRGTAIRYFARRNPRMIVGGAMVVAWLLIALLAPVVAPYDPIKVTVGDALRSPSLAHLLGTDDLGRDVLSRVIWGSRISLSVGLISVGIGFFVG